MITHIIITLVAVFITTYLTHRYAISREDRNWNRTLEIMRIQEFNKASAVFRAIFAEELHRLRQNGADTDYILDNKE